MRYSSFFFCQISGPKLGKPNKPSVISSISSSPILPRLVFVYFGVKGRQGQLEKFFSYLCRHLLVVVLWENRLRVSVTISSSAVGVRRRLVLYLIPVGQFERRGGLHCFLFFFLLMISLPTIFFFFSFYFFIEKRGWNEPHHSQERGHVTDEGLLESTSHIPTL